MFMLSTYEQTPIFDPSNPNQQIVERYTPNPGGYGSFYWNKVPTKTDLFGSGLADDPSSTGFLDAIPTWGQALLVGGLATIAGYLATKHLGPKVGLSGPIRSRR